VQQHNGTARLSSPSSHFDFSAFRRFLVRRIAIGGDDNSHRQDAAPIAWISPRAIQFLRWSERPEP